MRLSCGFLLGTIHFHRPNISGHVEMGRATFLGGSLVHTQHHSFPLKLEPARKRTLRAIPTSGIEAKESSATLPTFWRRTLAHPENVLHAASWHNVRVSVDLRHSHL